MRFRYDPAKAAANFRKHGISFADAEGVFQDPLAVTMEDPDAEGERRFIAVGSGNATELLVVVYTMRGEEVRLISARRATRKERKTYES
ncbi:MAG: BrnT family toxin [Betaproteobacteria bacterium]|nr:MAG: BrnT family toxin [Betaproteobacteria bacterium]TMH80241.1 MAG: BrnT family toxin [Betaproteobacteria bacterium]